MVERLPPPDIYSALMSLKHLREKKIKAGALFTFRLKLPHLSVKTPKGTPLVRSGAEALPPRALHLAARSAP